MASAQTLPYLPRNEYRAAVSAYGEGGTGGSIYQDVPLYLNEYNNHYHVRNPSDWEVQGTALRYLGYPPEQQPFEQIARTTTSDANNGTINIFVKSDAFQADASASIQYYFTLIGPDADYVPITITGYADATVKTIEPGWARGGAEFRVDYRDPLNGNGLTDSTVKFANGTRGDFSVTINVKPNLSYYNGAPRITLSAFAGVGGTDCNHTIEPQPCAGSGNVMIDPFFEIADPALAALYKIVGYDGRVLSGPAGPVAPSVPEPATWAMMIGGLGLVGTSLRRRPRTDIKTFA